MIVSARRNKKNALVKRPHEVSPNAQSYWGPIKEIGAKQQAVTTTFTLFDCIDMTSTMAAVLNPSYGSRPDNAPKWAAFSALFEEFRVLGWEIEFQPKDRYSKSTTICVPILAVVDREDATALTSYDQAASYDSARLLSLESPWKVSVHMQNAEESQFQQTSSPASLSYIKFYGDGLSSSTVYGKVFISYKVQFRGVYGV